MATAMKRIQAPLDDVRTRRLDALVGHNDAYLSALTSVLGVEVDLPATQAGAAGVLLSTLLDRVEQAVLQQRLTAHYAVMFPGGLDNPEDHEGLATDRALAASTAAYYRDFDGEPSAEDAAASTDDEAAPGEAR